MRSTGGLLQPGIELHRPQAIRDGLVGIVRVVEGDAAHQVQPADRRVVQLLGFDRRELDAGDVRQFARQLQGEPVEILARTVQLDASVEKRVLAATARADRLTQAILAKAFRGELVPAEAELARAEGRDYEPASVLLARVRAQQADRQEPSRRGRRGKK